MYRGRLCFYMGNRKGRVGKFQVEMLRKSHHKGPRTDYNWTLWDHLEAAGDRQPHGRSEKPTSYWWAWQSAAGVGGIG